MNKHVHRIDLVHPTLFGNDAAEDEQQDVFDSYFVPRQEVADFLSSDYKLRILRAYKGEGKSAILRKAFFSLQGEDVVVTRTTGSALAPSISTVDPDQWVKSWKQALFLLLACEIGTRIGMAWSDDAISLVETAEQTGFKERSFVSSVIDRLQRSGAPLQREVLGATNPEKTLERWMKGPRTPLWVFVDDIDENFQNTREFRIKLASFFTACRHVVNLLPEIRIRAGIRPNVWAILKADSESLSKVEQYLLDLRWDLAQMRSILAKRVEGFLQRSDETRVIQSICNYTGAKREEKLISMAFEEEMSWGFSKEQHKPEYRQPHIVMATLSSYRPRWMIELAKVAARRAKQSNDLVISVSHLSQELTAFGRNRIADLSAEYHSLCPHIQEIINAFVGQSEDFTTAALHKTINTRVLPGLNVTISGVDSGIRAAQVAAMLYEVGFLTAREEFGEKAYRHYTFAERPDLLHSRPNIDQGMSWEIHPVFRQALGMRDADGRKISKQKAKIDWDSIK